MRFLKELIARKLQSDRHEEWDVEADDGYEADLEAETAEAEADEWEDELPEALAKLRTPLAEPEPAPEPDAAEEDLPESRKRGLGTTYELARSFSNTEMRNLLNRVSGPEAEVSKAEAPAAPKPAKIWDIQGGGATPRQPEAEAPARPAPADAAAVETVAPPRPPGRQKTRLLGFQQAPVAQDIFASPVAASGQDPQQFPTGWIVVVEGPGRGACFTLGDGVSQIGRGEDQAIRLDFGDASISRNNHAAVAFDPELGKFFLGHGGKSNLVRLNGRPVLSTEELATADAIKIGETVLRFVALCGDGFSWAEEPKRAADAASA
jgi:hypothetical protein